MANKIEVFVNNNTRSIIVLRNGVAEMWIDCINEIHFQICLKLILPRDDNFSFTLDYSPLKLGKRFVNEQN
jgi:hypothetical protein